MITSIVNPEAASESELLRSADPEIECVFLTPSESEFRAARAILNATPILLHHAATLEQAHFQLTRTEARVLLSELQFPDGNWEDALEMLASSHPRVVLVLAATDADERLWISVLERGAFDLVAMPFRAEELRRLLKNADAHSQTANRTDAASTDASPATDSWPEGRGTGSTES